jgi:DNA uptake protein ComE-like DNA-binding protein
VRSILRSWWALLALLPFGWLNWSAFLYVGLRGRRPLWLLFAAIYFLAATASITLVSLELDPDVYGWRSSTGTGIGLASWAAGFVQALVIRQTYLDRMDALEDPRLDHAEDELRVRKGALELVAHNPRHARDLGVGRPDLQNSFDGGLVDLNNASARVIASLPGVDEQVAQRAVVLRDEIGGFDSLLDFADLLDIPPNTVERLRERAVVLPR